MTQFPRLSCRNNSNGHGSFLVVLMVVEFMPQDLSVRCVSYFKESSESRRESKTTRDSRVELSYARG